ncbi:putative ribonuclease H-like domain-containing protein [Tanacetum coccineum]
MDLFGPVSVESINKKRYCLVVTDDFSRFSWVFFLATKDETSEILCKFIIGLENQLNHNVKIIRCDNGTEFKNHAMNEFYAKKGIKREFSVARTLQQNGVAKKKNRTLIKAARTMLADSLLPIPFWAEAVNIACYVLNRVLVTKPLNKTPYELLIGNSPSISFMRPFGCPLTILNTLDSLGKFDGKFDEGYLLGYSTTSKAFRVYNKRTKRVKENLHIDFLEDQPNVTGTGHNWMFDLDFLTNSINYIPVSVENQVNVDAEDVAPATHEKPSKSSPKDNDVQVTEDVADKEGQHQMTEDKQVLHDKLKKMIAQEVVAKALDDATRQAFEEEKRNIASQKRAAQATSTNKLSTVRSHVSTATTPYVSAASTPIGGNAGESSFVYLGGQIPIDASTLPNGCIITLPMQIYPLLQNPDMEDAFYTLLNNSIIKGAYYLIEEEDGCRGISNNRKIQKASSAQQAIFKLQQVWILVDLPFGKNSIATKWVFKNKRDERSIVVENKARLVAQGFALSIKWKLKVAFLYGINKKSIVHQPPGFIVPWESLHSFWTNMLKQQLMESYKFPEVYDWIKPDILLKSVLVQRFKSLQSFPFTMRKEDRLDISNITQTREIHTGGCQFLGRRLISWQCKKQTIVANSTTKAEYVVAAHCCGQTFRTKGFDVTRFNCLVLGQHWNVKSVVTFEGRISMDLRMDRCSPGKYYSSMVFRTLANGTQQLIASIDSKEYTITEASVRSKLQLADATGIHNLSNAEIYVGLATFGCNYGSRSYKAPLPEGNTSGSAEDSMQLKELMVLVPSLVTRVTSLEKELKDTKQTLGTAVIKLVNKVKSLEKALKMKSKKVIVSASEGEEPEDQGRIIQDINDDPLVSLVRESMKEKSTDFVTPKKSLGDAQEEEISPTILEAAKTLSKVSSQSVSKANSTDKGKRYRRRARSMAKKINTGLDAEDEINTGRVEINTGIEDVNTGSAKVDSGTASKRGQREGNALMVEEDIQATHKTKEQISQEEAVLEEAIKLQAQMDEEVTKKIH